jgi:hypothetical protein
MSTLIVVDSGANLGVKGVESKPPKSLALEVTILAIVDSRADPSVKEAENKPLFWTDQ